MEKCSISFMWFRLGQLDAPMMSKKCVCVCVGGGAYNFGCLPLAHTDIKILIPP